jgi:hypothetical protein
VIAVMIEILVRRWRNVILRLRFDPPAQEIARWEDDGGA